MDNADFLFGTLTGNGRGLDDIGHDLIALFLRLFDFLQNLRRRALVLLAECSVGGIEGIHGTVTQYHSFLLQLLNGQRRGEQHSLVQIGKGFFFLCFGNDSLRDHHKALGKRQENHRADHVEEGVEHGDLG